MNRHAKSLIITIVFLFGFLPAKPFIFAPTIPVLLSWGSAVLDVSGKLAAFYLLGKRFNHRHLPIANAPVPAAPESTEVYGFMSEPGKPIIFEDLPHEVQQDLLQQVQPIATANPATPTLQPSTTTTPVLKTIPPASTKTLANQAASSVLKAASNDLLSPQSLAKMKAAAQMFKDAEAKHMLMKGLSNPQGRELVAKIVPAKSLAAKLIATSKEWAGKGVEKILPYAPIIGPVISAYSVYSNIETLKAAYHTYNAGNSGHDKPGLKNSGNTPPSQDDNPNKKLKDTTKIGVAKKAADELEKNKNKLASTKNTPTLVHQGSEAILKDGYYEVNGFKFTEYYYNYLWNNGRKAPTLAAKAILKNAQKITPDVKKAGFFKYLTKGWEMVYNPTTKEIWHLQQLK